jgi:hypothetical protein
MAVLWFSPGSPVSSINKTDRHNITEILLKVVLSMIKPTTKKQSLTFIFIFVHFIIAIKCSSFCFVVIFFYGIYSGY